MASMSDPPFDLDILRVLCEIRGTLVNKTPLRIGSGRRVELGSVTDTPLLKARHAGREKPFIPGPSLKGVMRNFVESLAKTKYEESDHRYPCNIFDYRPEVVEKEKENPCIACQIFGNRDLASHVSIFDAYPINEYSIATKTGIGISRPFGGVQPGVIYTEEFVSPGTKWSFRMRIWNIDIFERRDDRAELLVSLLDAMVKPGLMVGGRKTVGYGLIELVPAETRVHRFKFRDWRLVEEPEGGVTLQKLLEGN